MVAGNGVDGGEETVSTPGQRLDKTGLFGGVAQDVTQAIYGGVEALIVFHERIGGPEALLKFFSGDQFAGALEKQRENEERLIRQAQPGSIFS